MITLIGSTKGGVGKTTLSYNFAVTLAQAGQDVLLIDGDEQAHCMSFAELRKNNRPDGPNFDITSLLGKQFMFKDNLGKIERHQEVIIDVGGRDTDSFRNALFLADLILVPTVPRTADVWGSISTAQVINQVRQERKNRKLRAVGLINKADARGQDNEASLAELREIEGLEVSPVLIGDRKAYHNALARGLGILEYSDRNDRLGVQKAQADFLELFTSIYPKLERKIA